MSPWTCLFHQAFRRRAVTGASWGWEELRPVCWEAREHAGANELERLEQMS